MNIVSLTHLIICVNKTCYMLSVCDVVTCYMRSQPKQLNTIRTRLDPKHVLKTVAEIVFRIVFRI